MLFRSRAARGEAARGRLLRRGAGRGEVSPDALDPVVAGVAPAMVIQGFLVAGTPLADEALAAIVDRVLLRLIAPPPA